jgi:sugar transferase (PEP-CTERM/EpsH1 system associated)
MNILFLTSRLPYPPNRGDRLRAFNFIQSLHREHEIYLITFISSDEELQCIPELKQFCHEIKYVMKKPAQSLISVLLNIWRSEPLQSLFYRSSSMSKMINHAIGEGHYDAIYIHLFRMAQFVINFKDQYRILDLTDVISNEVKRSLPYRNSFWKLLYSVEYPRILNYERKLTNLFEETWLVSASEHQILSSQIPQANIITITNGIDTQIYHPIDIRPIPHRIIFTGHMGVPHNIDAARFFALEVFPDIQKMFPDSKFIIAGADPAQSVLDLSSQPNVEVLGYVEDLNFELNRSHIFIAPLRFAAGVQNKVLEAMAAGRPVVTTRMVNEGINAKEDHEIIVADSTDEYIMKLSRLFNDDEYRMKISQAGLDFVRENFSWDHVLQRVNVIEGMLSGIEN